jgi:hypothetical protein
MAKIRCINSAEGAMEEAMTDHWDGIRYRCGLYAALILILGLGAVGHVPSMPAAAGTLPERLNDQEFWQLTEQFSEPEGYFRSDNLLSNEIWQQYVIPELIGKIRPGGAYLGVGPEQNFTYIAALKPRIAFVIDIRRGNLHTQLMYKALFELASDRVDFVARLFTRKRPDGLDGKSAVREIFQKMEGIPAGDEEAFKENLKAILYLLTKKHRFPLSAEDLAGIEYVYRNFYAFGPGINYNSSGHSFGGRAWGFMSYAGLMTLTDENGVSRGFLANDENFKTVKNLQEKNLIIPIVGDFSGPKALRAIGQYLKEHNATVAAFYVSNVEQYLRGTWGNFCTNVASLPLDEKSTFIRASWGGGYGFRGPGGGLMTWLGEMQEETKGCADLR